MAEMHGTLLPFVLLTDFTRFLRESYRKSISGTADSGYWDQLVEKSLNLMERAMGSSEDLQELVSVSFLESLLPDPGDDGELYRGIKSLLGPKLREELRHYEPEP